MILYINTSAEYCETALFSNSKVMDSLVHDDKLKHSQVIHLQFKQLLESNSISYQDLEAVAVMNGPGSYTGLRVGLTAAKSICYAADKPLILLNKLECLAKLYSDQNDNQATIAILPARKDEYFAHSYNSANKENVSKLLLESDLNQILTKKSSSLVTLTNVNLPTEIEVSSVQLNIEYISLTCRKMLETLDFSDIFKAEPFYFKGVYTNKAKPKF